MSENIYNPNTDAIAYASADIKHSQGKSDAISVSDALNIAKLGLETIRVKVVGEVSQLSNKSGYKAVYFSIKDKRSVLPCLMWKNRYMSAGVDIEVGALVEITGRFSLYAAKGRMNFDVESINLAGEGQLRLAVAKLAKKLESMGLTSSLKKLEIPESPERIGVITSPRGAVIHDIIRTLNRRNPNAKVFFAGCCVEGNDAPSKMIEALKCLTKTCVDVILLCRGGGSFEDLMPFNDEQLAMAISECTIPVVTGIGHEPDTTIADLVSDKRASTPTAAAETVSINALDLTTDMQIRLEAIKRNVINRLGATEKLLATYSNRPIFRDPTQLFSADFQTLDMTTSQFLMLIKNFLPKFQAEIELGAAKLDDKSPLKILSKGYSVVKNSQNVVIRKAEEVELGDKIDITLSRGRIMAEVTETNND